MRERERGREERTVAQRPKRRLSLWNVYELLTSTTTSGPVVKHPETLYYARTSVLAYLSNVSSMEPSKTPKMIS